MLEQLEQYFLPSKYDDFEKIILKGGVKAKTFLISKDDTKYVLQLYCDDYISGNYISEAQKKFYISQRIRANNPACKVQNVLEYKNNIVNSYLIADFIKGETIRQIREKGNSVCLSVWGELAKALYEIHSIPCTENFGWIRGNSQVDEHKTFIDFVESEYNRINLVLKDNFSEIDFLKILEKEDELRKYIMNKPYKPKLTWHDLNPSNILTNEGFFTAIIDSGQARFDIPETDLAFLKALTCLCDEEFFELYAQYKKYEPSIDEQLIDKLMILIEIENIYLRIEENINIPIPYSTVFYDINKKSQEIQKSKFLHKQH